MRGIRLREVRRDRGPAVDGLSPAGDPGGCMGSAGLRGALSQGPASGAGRGAGAGGRLQRRVSFRLERAGTAQGRPAEGLGK